MTTIPAVPSAAFDTIILLSASPEADTLAALLKQHAPGIAILTPPDKAAMLAIPADTLARARLIGFLTPIIVPASVLAALGYGAYNIHPGPPNYPGWLPSHFAAYDGAGVFGATAHVMVEEIDAGPIVGVEFFNVPPGATVFDIERLAFLHCARLIWRLAPALACQPAPLPQLPLHWGARRSTRAMVRAVCSIPADIEKDELERRIAGFGGGYSGVAPTITLHGHTFRYAPPEQTAATAADKQVA